MTPATRIGRSFALTLAVVTCVLSLPYGCLEATAVGCLDSWPFTLHNESGQRVIATPFFVDRKGQARTLVVHGLQRGRFGIADGARRELDLETGDYPFDGISLAFEDGSKRVLPQSAFAATSEDGNIYIGRPESYALASPDLIEQASATALLAVSVNVVVG